MGRKLIDFGIKTNVALVEVLPPKESSTLIKELIDLDQEETNAIKGITIPQAGNDYAVVKVAAVSDQNFELQGCETQFQVLVGHYYIISPARLSLIGGIDTTVAYAFVATQDLLVHLVFKEEE